MKPVQLPDKQCQKHALIAASTQYEQVIDNDALGRDSKREHHQQRINLLQTR